MSISRDKVSLSPVEGRRPSRPGFSSRHCRRASSRTAPLLVGITIANLTDIDTPLEIKGPRDETSPLIVANGTASFKVDLPTGDYLISAADIPGAVAARLNVGPDRASSQNDLLLP